MKNDKIVGELPPKDDQVDPEYRPIPRNQFSQFATKLDVNFVDPEYLQKWHTYWFIDRGNDISNALMSGYQFVDKDEVQGEDMHLTPRDNDLGTRVRRHAGTGEMGEPQYHYLMKKPMEFHLAHEAEREAYHRTIEGAIRDGNADRQPNDGRYSANRPPPGGTSLPGITISTKLSR